MRLQSVKQVLVNASDVVGYGESVKQDCAKLLYMLEICDLNHAIWARSECKRVVTLSTFLTNAPGTHNRLTNTAQPLRLLRSSVNLFSRFSDRASQPA